MIVHRLCQEKLVVIVSGPFIDIECGFSNMTVNSKVQKNQILKGKENKENNPPAIQKRKLPTDEKKKKKLRTDEEKKKPKEGTGVTYHEATMLDLFAHNEDLWESILDEEVLREVRKLWEAHNGERDLTMVDFFAGCAGLSKAGTHEWLGIMNLIFWMQKLFLCCI